MEEETMTNELLLQLQQQREAEIARAVAARGAERMEDIKVLVLETINDGDELEQLFFEPLVGLATNPDLFKRYMEALDKLKPHVITCTLDEWKHVLKELKELAPTSQSLIEFFDKIGSLISLLNSVKTLEFRDIDAENAPSVAAMIHSCAGVTNTRLGFADNDPQASLIIEQALIGHATLMHLESLDIPHMAYNSHCQTASNIPNIKTVSLLAACGAQGEAKHVQGMPLTGAESQMMQKGLPAPLVCLSSADVASSIGLLLGRQGLESLTLKRLGFENAEAVEVAGRAIATSTLPELGMYHITLPDSSGALLGEALGCSGVGKVEVHLTNPDGEEDLGNSYPPDFLDSLARFLPRAPINKMLSLTSYMTSATAANFTGTEKDAWKIHGLSLEVIGNLDQNLSDSLSSLMRRGTPLKSLKMKLVDHDTPIDMRSLINAVHETRHLEEFDLDCWGMDTVGQQQTTEMKQIVAENRIYCSSSSVERLHYFTEAAQPIRPVLRPVTITNNVQLLPTNQSQQDVSELANVPPTKKRRADQMLSDAPGSERMTSMEESLTSAQDATLVEERAKKRRRTSPAAPVRFSKRIRGLPPTEN
ncbi:hypothetical protein MPSEU_001092900 [Mayamaea pseudoterrestris]|nr:hypothetical protein MPSEU_001092900 [Mayamaea pseudoterrestris]